MSEAAPRLEPLRRAQEEGLLAMGREFHEAGEVSYDPLLRDADAWFELAARYECGTDLPADRVRMTTHLLVRGARPLGVARLRHHLIPVLQRDGGHIGYEIRPKERGNGLATLLLFLMLDQARAIGLERVLLTAATTNAASIRVIEKNAGVPDGTVISPSTGAEMIRYWIEL